MEPIRKLSRSIKEQGRAGHGRGERHGAGDRACLCGRGGEGCGARSPAGAHRCGGCRNQGRGRRGAWLGARCRGRGRHHRFRGEKSRRVSARSTFSSTMPASRPGPRRGGLRGKLGARPRRDADRAYALRARGAAVAQEVGRGAHRQCGVHGRFRRDARQLDLCGGQAWPVGADQDDGAGRRDLRRASAPARSAPASPPTFPTSTRKSSPSAACRSGAMATPKRSRM